MILDALGNEIVIGNWYGYSRSDSGHITIGCAIKVSDGKIKEYLPSKVRLGNCIVKEVPYGFFTGFKKDPKDVTIASFMVFPVPAPDEFK